MTVFQNKCSINVEHFKPVPQGRPRVTKFGHTYDPKAEEKKEFIKLVKEQLCENFNPINTIFHLHVNYVFEIPKSYSKKKREEVLSNVWHSTKPDLDNLIKFTLDSLNGILYTDDKLCVRISATKMYGSINATSLSIHY